MGGHGSIILQKIISLKQATIDDPSYILDLSLNYYQQTLDKYRITTPHRHL